MIQIIEKEIDSLIEYENNPRYNDRAVDAVMASIKNFGFKNPIVIDKDGIIICGHTRKKAAEKLGYEKVPCIVADDLTDEQLKAFRIADNKTAELSEWDFVKLDEELAQIEIDMSQFGINVSNFDWDSIGDITSEAYETPEKDALKCPKCGCIDIAFHFKKVPRTEMLAEAGEEE